MIALLLLILLAATVSSQVCPAGPQSTDFTDLNDLGFLEYEYELYMFADGTTPSVMGVRPPGPSVWPSMEEAAASIQEFSLESDDEQVFKNYRRQAIQYFEQQFGIRPTTDKDINSYGISEPIPYGKDSLLIADFAGIPQNAWRPVMVKDKEGVRELTDTVLFPVGFALVVGRLGLMAKGVWGGQEGRPLYGILVYGDFIMLNYYEDGSTMKIHYETTEPMYMVDGPGGDIVIMISLGLKHPEYGTGSSIGIMRYIPHGTCFTVDVSITNVFQKIPMYDPSGRPPTVGGRGLV